ncbi:hypothetical protein ACKLNO_01700 [Neisseriaceae bacterium B1]
MLACIAGISWYLLKANGFGQQFDLTNFLVKIPVIIPLIFVAWISNKRNAYLFRLREDYAYKYASAMAFEGYKKQVQEHDAEMMQQLLKIALDNLGDKPQKIFDKEIKSPMAEAIEPVRETVKDVAQTIFPKSQ